MPPKSTKRKRTRTRTKAAAKKKGTNSCSSSTIPESKILAPYFPDNIWFEILSWLPATGLKYYSRVCKTWATMIHQPDFATINLHRSNPQFITIIRSEMGIMWRMWPNGIEAFRINNIDSPGVVHSTSQGLCIYDRFGAYYVINPVTMQRAEISRIDHLVPHRSVDDSYSYSALLDCRSGEVKLVFAYTDYDEESFWYVQRLGIEKSWKKIRGGHRFGKLDFPGMSISGYLIYGGDRGIVVLDVSVETVHMICCPTKVFPVTYLQMGKDVLSCISHDSGKLFIHILKEFVAGNWSLYKILDYGDVHGVSPEFHHFHSWQGKNLFVRTCKSTFINITVGRSCYKLLSEEEWKNFIYNLETKEFRPLCGCHPAMSFDKLDGVMLHAPSLLSWKTLQA